MSFLRDNGKHGYIPVDSDDAARNTKMPSVAAIHTLIRSDGKVTGYVLSNGQNVTKEQAEDMAIQGKLDLRGTSGTVK
ncbi:MAG: hypothetical protein FWD00_03650 [Clostridiales bacterium]|nr:hypothetical protein [Clostridiales bacterium]